MDFCTIPFASVLLALKKVMSAARSDEAHRKPPERLADRKTNDHKQDNR